MKELHIEHAHFARHITDLLPAYVNKTLDRVVVQQVEQHLAVCATCRDELADWQRISTATVLQSLETQSTEAPSLALLTRVWEEVDREVVPIIAQSPRGWWSPLRGFYLVLFAQVRLLSKACWLLMPVVIAAFFFLVTRMSDQQSLPAALSFIAPAVTAICVSFIQNKDNDPYLEITLSTNTSLRLVLISRYLLVFGYNFALSLLATLLLILVRGGDLSLVFSLWIGPMVLLSSIGLLLTIMVNSLSSVASIVLLWYLHLLASLLSLNGAAGEAKLFFLDFFWQTNAGVLVCGLFLLALAIFLVPRQASHSKTRMLV